MAREEHSRQNEQPVRRFGHATDAATAGGGRREQARIDIRKEVGWVSIAVVQEFGDAEIHSWIKQAIRYCKAAIERDALGWIALIRRTVAGLYPAPVEAQTGVVEVLR